MSQDKRYLRCPYCGFTDVQGKKNSIKGRCNECGLPFRVEKYQRVLLYSNSMKKNHYVIFGKGYRLSPDEILENKLLTLPTCIGWYSQPIPNRISECINCKINKFCKHYTLNKNRKS